MRKTVFLLIVFLQFANCYPQAMLQSGPMLGYSDMREAVVWLQTTESATVQIRYWSKKEPNETFVTTEIETAKEKAFTALLVADNAEPGNVYEYVVLINGKKAELPYATEFQTQKVWRWRGDPPDFSLATGSCTYINEEEYDRPGKPYGSGYKIFESIYKSSPDIMLWLGDNTYFREADWNSWTGITKRWTHTRSIPELQPLLASTHNYAIWDDHDYGPNDSDRGFWNKQATFEVFKLFWANPSYGIGDMEGVMTQFQWADVDFILLDNRFYRSPNKIKEEEKTVLGHKQKQWLKDALISSQGSFKIIVIGGQFLNDAGKYEAYSSNGFGEERQEIIDFIYKHSIKNVVFLTGDRHHTELSVMEQSGKPRIIDLTVSPLTSGPSTNRDEQNSYRVKGTYVNKRNYGRLKFTGSQENREIQIQIKDIEGITLWERSFSLQQ